MSISKRSLVKWIILSLANATFFTGTQSHGQNAGEYEVKAACIFNFAQFVKWPPKAFPDPSAPLTIGLLGDDSFGGALDRVFQGQNVGGRRLTIRRSRRIEDLKDCQMVFISKSEKARVGESLSALRGAATLTVGEMDQFAAQGGMINFIVQGGKAGFEINPGAAQHAGLEINSRLLKLAKIISN